MIKLYQCCSTTPRNLICEMGIDDNRMSDHSLRDVCAQQGDYQQSLVSSKVINFPANFDMDMTPAYSFFFSKYHNMSNIVRKTLLQSKSLVRLNAPMRVNARLALKPAFAPSIAKRSNVPS